MPTCPGRLPGTLMKPLLGGTCPPHLPLSSPGKPAPAVHVHSRPDPPPVVRGQTADAEHRREIKWELRRGSELWPADPASRAPWAPRCSVSHRGGHCSPHTDPQRGVAGSPGKWRKRSPCVLTPNSSTRGSPSGSRAIPQEGAKRPRVPGGRSGAAQCLSPTQMDPPTALWDILGTVRALR